MRTFVDIDSRMREGGGHILCLGAHCDDIDIGAGGALLTWLDKWPETRVTWIAFCSDDQRASELRKSASQFLKNAASFAVIANEFRNGYLPFVATKVKDYFETLKALPEADIILTHQREDRHQDHRLVNQLTWNTFRSNFILEYEIPKFDGELPHPNTFVEISEQHIDMKAKILQNCYGSQTVKQWFDDDLFRGLARLRGVECDSRTRFAEAFIARKIGL